MQASDAHTHRCIACQTAYTPQEGESEDCPVCGCDGTSDWIADNAVPLDFTKLPDGNGQNPSLNLVRVFVDKDFN